MVGSPIPHMVDKVFSGIHYRMLNGDSSVKWLVYNIHKVEMILNVLNGIDKMPLHNETL